MVKPNLSRKKRDKREEKTRKQKYKYSGGSQAPELRTITNINKEINMLGNRERKAFYGLIGMGKKPENALKFTKNQASIAKELKYREHTKPQDTEPQDTKPQHTKLQDTKPEEVNGVVVEEEDNEKLEKTKGIFLKIKKLLDKIYPSAEVNLHSSNYRENKRN
jgi:hypothetical protein